MKQQFLPIQNHILYKLKNSKSKRYNQLHPKDKTPNDLFNYHLQFLVKKGFIIKKGSEYSLDEKGIQYVADLTLMQNENKVTALFKYNVITIVSRIHKGKIQILNQIRGSNPSFGKVGVMGGAVLKGELIEDAATRKLKIETGVEARFHLVGMERRMMYVKNELFSDILFPIAYANSSMGEPQITDYGENKWLDIDESLKHQKSNTFDQIESITKVLKAVKNKKINKLPFFYIETVKIGDIRP